MSTLLPFHTKIIQEIHDPSTSELIILARGLGLRRIICTLMKIYDSPQNLVLLVNATPEEETEIGEELGIMGCRKPGLRVVGYETGTSKDRQNLYKNGGLISVTSRILVVDMLQNDIPINLITGIIVLHAERVSPLHLVSFITRLYREKNDSGFLKAFTDQPEHITSGLSPLKNVMKELRLRKVHIWPRFHQDIKRVLERKRADVVELSQHLTTSMEEIHSAIVQCMNTTLAELRRSRTELDLDTLALPAAYFSSFDHIVRKQLDPVWNKVGSSTKALVRDLGVLRRLVWYLLTYDPLQFHSFCETLIASNSTSAGGGAKSQWMLTDTANIVFSVAKRRCFTLSVPTASRLDDDDDAWQVLDEIQGKRPDTNGDHPRWIPPRMDPVLEELPKWSLLAEVLEEIEGEIIKIEGNRAFNSAPGTNTTLVMCSSITTCNLLNEFMASLDQTRPKGEWGRKLMMKKLKTWLFWKSCAAKDRKTPTRGTNQGQGDDLDDVLDEALKKKDRDKADRKANRRRIRGGGPGAASSGRQPSEAPEAITEDLWNYGELKLLNDEDVANIVDLTSLNFEPDFDAHYGLLPPAQTVLIRPYSDDTDDRMLDEIKPRFIVMFEPCMEFIRRVEVYKCSNPGLSVRVYHMVYANSCEEHKYLAGIRREKESFERLIRERGDPKKASSSDEIIKTISTRIAGGRRELNKDPSRVIVDMREFRSTLPSLLHATNLLVIPATLTVGDYILTPEICVERKSLADLVSSFNNGRLYTQCELMSVHYKNPVLLIEFEEDKAFSLEIISDMKSYAKTNNRFSSKKATGNPTEYDYTSPSIQSKIVLLTLTFPRVRIIWSSSPYATAEIFKDLKMDRAEPDPAKAIAIGAEEDPDSVAGINAAAEELLRSLPGISAKNIKYVMSKVRNVRELCEMDLRRVQDILGVAPGKACYQFIHRGER
ncbi:uncharacterized protein BT62DRAFT_981292 [Guyanagaster necrorhizus]|uniref:ERCC4 domain-containing protein n=1 Tax=Guyanagaster necrorhizus TaxID=856835 RepID=A0A9P7VQK2_9AGAR|nr:uncharacterized protein BT62DRAFT_981292 [Guyanagaster necrorhizus MCA 3950]KAG7444880.1 hypothetical protein BT62DRAFT_981292 [Guyanagaster necrorhizus MCA 3950]